MLIPKKTGSFCFLSLGSQQLLEIQVPGDHHACYEGALNSPGREAIGEALKNHWKNMWEKTSWAFQASVDTH